ncbi:MAG: hypothetical protein P0Y49_09365 [Candidatus Pedobacter colombiensis]|uniref:Uncharacterized protein n=1 Tax=Candidatus Pedobacter colombiensis TaxID=3121371 RepID=A0AAJ6B8X7_9SPHI|nr:hypothetical protein [Pedobacter sp.]WEK21349.1 MAG: hypothetical protein P0Y49_09365 [Pedobacter sp.]
MLLNFILYGVYLLCLLIVIWLGAVRLRIMEQPARIFYVLILISFVSELTASGIEYFIGDNHNVYNVTDIIQMFTVCLYFTACLKKWWIVALGYFSIAFGVYDYFWLQQEDLINNYFLLWCGIVVISLCLYMMVFLSHREGHEKLTRFAHFWFSAALMFYWTVDLLNSQVFNSAAELNKDYAAMLNAMHIVTNIIAYGIIGFGFWCLPKLIQ